MIFYLEPADLLIVISGQDMGYLLLGLAIWWYIFSMIIVALHQRRIRRKKQ